MQKLPEWIQPMAATLTQERFTGPEWIGALLVGYYENASLSEPPASAGGSVSVPRAVATGSSDASVSVPPAVAGESVSVPRAVAPGSSDASVSVPRAVATGSTDNLAMPSDFVFAGKIGTGFDTKMLLDLRAQLDKLEIDKPPFTKAVGLPRLRAHWVRPEIVVHVGFIQWTKYGKLRHPRLLGVRTDKDARDVVKE